MAATTSHGQHQSLHLPPSPPSAPSSPRRRHKKKLDPFEELARTPVPSRSSSPINEPQDDESLLTKIILTPILFISFILSLFLVNYRNRARRTEAHSHYKSILSYLTPSSWRDPEPYQDPDDSTWGRGGPAGHVEPHDAIGPRQDAQKESESGKKKRKYWHLNRKIRQVAKLEISDAFEMRGRIMLGMAVVMILGSVVMYMGIRLLVSFSQMLFRWRTERAVQTMVSG